MGTETVTVAQARSDFSNLLAQAELLDRRFVIARRGSSACPASAPRENSTCSAGTIVCTGLLASPTCSASLIIQCSFPLHPHLA